MAGPMGKSYKPWLIASLAILVLALMCLTVTVTVSFVYFTGKDSPIWLIVLFILSAMGVGLGFAGFFGLMVFAGWQSFREGQRVQVISPMHDDTKA
jgi:uncharacterized integral membrane protein